METFSQASSLQAEGKVQDALNIYQTILKESPDTDLKDEILIQMASCYIQLGDDDSAIKAYLIIIAAEPNSMDAANAVSLMANVYMQRYQFEDLLAMSRQIIQQFPGTESAAMAVYRVASYLYSKGENEKAIEQYQNFLEQFPKSTLRTTVFSRLVYLYITESMFKEAEDMITTSLKENPGNTYMVQQLGLVYRKQGKYDDAMALYQKLLVSSPKDTDILEQIGEIYIEKGDKDKAIAEWNKIIETSPSQYYLHQMVAGIFKSHGFNDLAAQEYRKAIELQPLASYLYTQLAELYIINKKYDSAIDVYLDALLVLPVSYPDRTEIIQNVLDLSKMDGLFDNIVQRLRSQIYQSPNNITAISSLADIYFYKGDIDNSIELFRKATSLYSDNGNLLIERAKWLKREQQPEKAIKIYNLIIELYPNTNNCLDAMMSIGELKAMLNQPKEAIDILQKMIAGAKSINNRTTKIRLVSAQIILGDLYLNSMSDLQSALSTYVEAKSFIDPQSDGMTEQMTNLILKIADCYRLMGNFDMALDALDSIPKESRSLSIEARITKQKGDCYFSMGDFSGAKTQYKKATKSNLKEDWANDALDRLALIDEYSGPLLDLLKSYANIERLKASGEYDNAFLECSNAMKKFPANGLIDRIQLVMGEIFDIKGKYSEAIKIYEVLVRPDSQFAPEAQFRIANIYWQRLNDKQRAIDTYSKLIRDYPDSVFVVDARKQLQQLSANGVIQGQALP
jgi:tetratricopeptide (TPR) repeat protein